MDLSVRAQEPELLDVGVSEQDALDSLADLRFVNRWLGNRRRFLAAVRSRLEASARPRLLDVGCGSADVPAGLVRTAARPLLAVGVDVKLLHLRAAPPEVRCVVADVRALPFAPGSFDVVTASLFLHHFPSSEIPDLLRRLYALARRALVVHDLRRSWVPYAFGRAFFPLLFRSRVSVVDGLISIRSGFTPEELAAAFAEAAIPMELHRGFPFRLLAVAERP
jgi:SAM-dependent methyltransferase